VETVADWLFRIIIAHYCFSVWINLWKCEQLCVSLILNVCDLCTVYYRYYYASLMSTFHWFLCLVVRAIRFSGCLFFKACSCRFRSINCHPGMRVADGTDDWFIIPGKLESVTELRSSQVSRVRSGKCGNIRELRGREKWYRAYVSVTVGCFLFQIIAFVINQLVNLWCAICSFIAS